jgi:hypothetical protein
LTPLSQPTHEPTRAQEAHARFAADGLVELRTY